LARAFVQDTQMTPAQFVDLLRVDAGPRLLEESTLPLQRIAFESGFSGAQARRRAFRRRLGSRCASTVPDLGNEIKLTTQRELAGIDARLAEIDYYWRLCCSINIETMHTTFCVCWI
jgi:hypothetical protein